MIYVIGIDPGPTPGLVGLHVTENRAPKLMNVDVVQCSESALIHVLNGLWDCQGSTIRLAVERFVVGSRAGRSRTASAGADTRKLVLEIDRWAGLHALTLPVIRTATAVKPWATDARLAAAGLTLPTQGMRHARDAARHALFSAVKDHGLPDPLSKRSAS